MISLSHRRPAAFTLVELLVVIAIIGILVALLLPAVQAAREAARRMQCSNNLKQIGLALHNYHAANQVFPQGSPCAPNNGAGCQVTNGASWTAAILPQLEQQNVFDLFDFTKTLADPANDTAVKAVVKVYLCPSDTVSSKPLTGGLKADGTPNYSPQNPPGSLALSYPGSFGNTADGWSPGTDACMFCAAGADSFCCRERDFATSPVYSGHGIFHRRSDLCISIDDIRDGTTNTFLAGETIPSQCSYNAAYGANFPLAGTTIPMNTFIDESAGEDVQWYRGCGFKSRHPGGAMFVLADGSVHFVSETIDYQLYNELGSRSGGEVAQLP